MPKRKKRYTGLYTPGVSGSLAFSSIGPPETTTDLEVSFTADDGTELQIPSGFIDAWTYNENYKELLISLEIAQMEYSEVVRELQSFYSKRNSGACNEGSREAPIAAERYLDHMTYDVGDDTKNEIVKLHQTS